MNPPFRLPDPEPAGWLRGPILEGVAPPHGSTSPQAPPVAGVNTIAGPGSGDAAFSSPMDVPAASEERAMEAFSPVCYLREFEDR